MKILFRLKSKAKIHSNACYFQSIGWQLNLLAEFYLYGEGAGEASDDAMRNLYQNGIYNLHYLKKNAPGISE